MEAIRNYEDDFNITFDSVCELGDIKIDPYLCELEDIQTDKSSFQCSIDAYASTMNFKEEEGTSSESVNNSPGGFDRCVSTAPTHLKFAKSKNVDLRTMRMLNQATLAGYNPFRGDFEVEYDNNAEELMGVAGILNDQFNLQRGMQTTECKESCKLLSELQLVLGECYVSRLKERQKRKEIIKNYGLMNRKGLHRWSAKLQNSLGKSNAKKMMILTRLLPVKRAEIFFSCLQNVYGKRAQLNKLIFYRSNYGVRTEKSKMLVENATKNYCKGDRIDIRHLVTPPTIKRNKTPLKIFHLPRYRELTAQEAYFCSLNNLQPEFFLETKDQLISDCKKNNGMLLKRARKLVKIDVNKTRKIFDFLMEQGLIWPSAK